jgi:hypothetical protein
MAAATARGTSDACIVAWPLCLERCHVLHAVQREHRTSRERRGTATDSAICIARPSVEGCRIGGMSFVVGLTAVSGTARNEEY